MEGFRKYHKYRTLHSPYNEYDSTWALTAIHTFLSPSGAVLKMQVCSTIPRSHRSNVSQFWFLWALHISLTHLRPKFRITHDTLQSVLFHYIISHFWGNQAPRQSFHFEKVHHKHVHKHTHPCPVIPLLQLVILWSFPLNILTAAGTWLISCPIISSVWPSEKKKTTH